MNRRMIIIPVIIVVGIAGAWFRLSDAIDLKVSTLSAPSLQWSIFESVDKFENSKYSCFVYSEINPDVDVFESEIGVLYALIETTAEVTRRVEDEVRNDKEDCRIQTKLENESESCQSFHPRDRLRYEYIVDGGHVVLERWVMDGKLVFSIDKDRVLSSLIEYRVLMDVIRNGKKREEVIYKGTALVPSPGDAWSQILECNRRQLAIN